MRGVGSGWKATVLGAVCLIGIPTVAAAQAAKAGVVTTLQGSATVARSTAPEPTPLKFRDDVFIQDHIVTAESSIVRILLGGKAVVTVRERSALTIHETPTTSTIEISAGKIALAVAKERMKPGESVQIKTPNAMAGVRGTVVIADVAPPAEAGGNLTTRFTLLTGIVDVTRLDAGQPAGPVTLLRPLQTIAVVGGQLPGVVRGISRAEAEAIAQDYQVSLPAPPPPANTQVTEQQVEIAARQAALMGNQPSVGDGPTGGGSTHTATSDETPSGSGSGSNPTRTVPGTNGGGTTVGATVNAGGGAVGASGGVSAGGGTVGAGGSVAVGGGSGVGASGGVTVGGGGVGAGGSVTVGGGSGVGAGGGVTVGSGGIGAGGSVTVGGGGIGAGGGVGAGGGGVTVGVGVGVGGIGVGGGVTVGGGGTGTGVTIGGGSGGTGAGGGGTGTGGGGGLVGGLLPKILPKK